MKYKFRIRTYMAITADQVIIANSDKDALDQFYKYKGEDLNWKEDQISYSKPTNITYEIIEE